MRFHRPPRAFTPLGTGETVGVDHSEGSGRPVDPGASAGLSAAFSAMSERVFQAQVVAVLRRRGYTVVVIPDMRRTAAGWPDLAFFHVERPGRLWLWELKAAKTKVTTIQRETIDLLATVPGVDARIVRPSDWSKLSEDV